MDEYQEMDVLEQRVMEAQRAMYRAYQSYESAGTDLLRARTCLEQADAALRELKENEHGNV